MKKKASINISPKKYKVDGRNFITNTKKKRIHISPCSLRIKFSRCSNVKWVDFSICSPQISSAVFSAGREYKLRQRSGNRVIFGSALTDALLWCFLAFSLPGKRFKLSGRWCLNLFTCCGASLSFVSTLALPIFF